MKVSIWIVIAIVGCVIGWTQQDKIDSAIAVVKGKLTAK